MERRTLLILLGAFAALAALALLRGPERLPAGPLSLSTAAGGSVDWASCPAAKCLTVYVAPWCGVCRRSTAFINALTAYLEARGVPARVVVGKDSAAETLAYARDFGPETLLDPEGRVPLAGGVPQFIVTSSDGTVLKRQPGVHRIVPEPVPEEDVRFLASHLGLP